MTLKHALGLLLAFMLSLGAASAAETGTPATINREGHLFAGPGTEYQVLGELVREVPVRVDRCTRGWCKIRFSGGSGWVAEITLRFGDERRLVPTPELYNDEPGWRGRACFYSGPNFTGSEICAVTGSVVQDLALYGLDNTFQSVTLEGQTAVTLCRDFNFTSYCERIIEDSPSLDRFLSGSVSSFRVH